MGLELRANPVVIESDSKVAITCVCLNLCPLGSLLCSDGYSGACSAKEPEVGVG